VIHDDGRRIARVTLPRWLTLSALALLVVAPVSVAFIYSDYLQLRSQRASFNDLAARVAEQRGVIEASQSKMREIRAEINGWRELHARIWEPSAPKTAPPSAEPASAAVPARRGLPRRPTVPPSATSSTG